MLGSTRGRPGSWAPRGRYGECDCGIGPKAWILVGKSGTGANLVPERAWSLSPCCMGRPRTEQPRNLVPWGQLWKREFQEPVWIQVHECQPGAWAMRNGPALWQTGDLGHRTQLGAGQARVWDHRGWPGTGAHCSRPRAGVHGEAGCSPHSPFATGRLSLSMLATWAWWRGDKE